MPTTRLLCALALILGSGMTLGAEPPATGLADSAALRATVYGPAPQDIAPLPATVPVKEINIALPWARPLPEVLWFDRRLRAWLALQDKPAPVVIVIGGTGSDGNSTSQSRLRAILYGAGYHVLSLPSPTFPRFIAAASSTGVPGDLEQDGRDLYATAQAILAHLPPRAKVTDVHIIGYSLGGANAAVVKSIDAREHRLNIHRAVMINPPVSLLASMQRLDRLFDQSIGPNEADIEQLYRRMYARLANFYRANGKMRVETTDMYAAIAAVLRTDKDFEAAIALVFRLDLMNMFYEGDLYAGTGVFTDPRHPPAVGDSTDAVGRELRTRTFAEYFERVFVPYYLARRPGATRDSLVAQNRLDLIGPELSGNPDYYALTNADDLILDADELAWLRNTLGERIAVYPHGGHLGNLGERQQAADLLQMLAGTWHGAAP
ncbi:MAG: alpha/beta fold hydrolase [Proteobacteria bacterium]|nr:alpha/beta fold hydrolase [Pseudomonadota bacterium]